MSSPTVFISYRHGDPSTNIANVIHNALSAVADGLGFDIFMDQHEIEPADLFDEVIIDGLDRTTHFLVVLDNDYWASPYCRKELGRAISRFEQGEKVRILFVKADAIDPQNMVFDKDRAVGRITSDDPLIKRVGDLQFLGPFDNGRRLERLKYEDRAVMRDQVYQLIQELKRVLPRRVS